MACARLPRLRLRAPLSRPHLRPLPSIRPTFALTQHATKLGPDLPFSSFPVRYFHRSSPCLDASIMPFKLHDIGEGITEVEILKWHVEVGSTVEEFDALCEVQSDKSVVELTSPSSGKIDAIKAEVGETVRVGQTICDIRTASSDDPDGLPEKPVEDSQQRLEEEESPAVRQAEEETERAEKEAESSAAKEDGGEGDLPPDELAALEARLLRPRSSMDLSGGAQFAGEGAVLPSPPRTPKPHPLNPDVARERTEIPAVAIIGSRRTKKALASPAVRTLAAKMGVDLSDVPGSGDEGRVTKDDLLAATPSSSTSSTTASPTLRESVPLTTRVEFGRTRKVMWRAMGAQGVVPHFGYSHTLDLTALLPYLQPKGPSYGSSSPTYMAADIPNELSRDPSAALESQQRKTTLLTFLVKGLLLAMEDHPIMRSRVKEQGDERWLEVGRDASIGIAVSDPKFGLLTPSLPPLSPDTSLSSITTHLAALRKSPTKPIAGAPPSTLTISSIGGLGETTGAMPVLPPGNLAICAVGRASWTFVPRHTQLSNRPFDYSPTEVEAGGMRAVLQVPVGWSGDHRVLEGAELIAFTESWKRWIEAPARWLRVE